MKLFSFVLFLFSGTLFAQYQVTALDGGPVKRKIIGEYSVNEHSSLQAKIFLLNHKDAGFQFLDTKLVYGYEDRKNTVSASLAGTIEREIVALKYRITLYDVFGEHIINLGGGEIRDYKVGSFADTGMWNSYDDDLFNTLTAVVYVYKVRFQDGTVWHVNMDELQVELAKLKLTELKENKK